MKRPADSRPPSGLEPRANESRHGEHRDEAQILLLRLREVARRLGISLAHAERLNVSGRLPQAIRLGRCVRWNAAELDAWVAAGAPSRDRWQAMRGCAR